MTEIQKKLDVIYDTKNNLALDIYQPIEKVSTAIIDIHGGGWFRGDKAKDSDLATRLAEEGFFVVVPNYRTTPDGYYPDPLIDMDNVMDWLKAAGYTKIMAVGSSAGGNMSVELGIKYGIPIVSLSGILDIDDWLAKHQDVVPQQDQKQDFVNQASATINQSGVDDPFYKWFVTNYFNGRTDQYEAATPYHRVNDQTGPMYLANSLDEFVPTSGVLTLAQKLTEHNIGYTMRMLPGTRHAKGYLDDVINDVVFFLKENEK